jgi:hypothetical protein
VADEDRRPRHRTFGAGTFTVVVAVTARDTDAAFYSIDIRFDGLWWGAAAIREHLQDGEPVLTRGRAL